MCSRPAVWDGYGGLAKRHMCHIKFLLLLNETNDYPKRNWCHYKGKALLVSHAVGLKLTVGRLSASSADC